MNRFAPNPGALTTNFEIRTSRPNSVSAGFLTQSDAVEAGRRELTADEKKERAARISVVLSNLDKYAPEYRDELEALAKVCDETTSDDSVVISGPISFEQFVELLKK